MKNTKRIMSALAFAVIATTMTACGTKTSVGTSNSVETTLPIEAYKYGLNGSEASTSSDTTEAVQETTDLIEVPSEGSTSKTTESTTGNSGNGGGSGGSSGGNQYDPNNPTNPDVDVNLTAGTNLGHIVVNLIDVPLADASLKDVLDKTGLVLVSAPATKYGDENFYFEGLNYSLIPDEIITVDRIAETTFSAEEGIPSDLPPTEQTTEIMKLDRTFVAIEVVDENGNIVSGELDESKYASYKVKGIYVSNENYADTDVLFHLNIKVGMERNSLENIYGKGKAYNDNTRAYSTDAWTLLVSYENEAVSRIILLRK